jgi:DNA ligase-1
MTTHKYPELHSVPIDDHTDVVLDGEVACIDPDTGSIDFELIQGRFQLKKPAAIEQAVLRQPVVFFAFDILRYKGRDLRGFTLPERKAILLQTLGENQHFSLVISVDGSGISLFDVIKAKKLNASRCSSRQARNNSAWGCCTDFVSSRSFSVFSATSVNPARRLDMFCLLPASKGYIVGIYPFAEIE